MAVFIDWLPHARDALLAMAANWVAVLGVKAAAWGVPEAVCTELGTLAGAAGGILEAAKNETTRTPVVTAHCKEAFKRLGAKMRDIKKRYFLSPPLEDADFVALGISPGDRVKSPTGKPEAQMRAEAFLAARHELGIKLVLESGNPDDPANKEYRIWYQVVGPGEAVPKGPEDLRNSFSTKRKKELMDFGYGSSGKTVYFMVQIENGKLKGPWGPMTSALIP
jgi:hypothetical protein